MSGEGGANRTGIRRARPQLSCVPCRQGKLKCNRVHPICDQCIKRSRDHACAYLPPPPRLRQTQNLKGRLRHLENLVLDLMREKNSQEASSATYSPTSQGRSTQSSEESPETSVTPADKEGPAALAIGQMSINQTETSYVGASHWSTILQEIKDVQNVLEDEDDTDMIEEPTKEKPYAGASISFGNPQYQSRKQLVEALPPKAEVDRLVTTWFNSQDPFIYSIHAPTFQKEYGIFWENKESMPIMWYGLLYAIVAVATLVGHRALPGGRDMPMSVIQRTDFYQNLAASAMAMADISKPQLYALECILLYTESQYLRWDNAHVKIWLMLGTAVRIALRMGCHRDSSFYPQLTVFQGEMRRRHWHLIYQLDVLVSFAIGLPSMIRTIESDTRAPHNILDTDFDANATELPPERPETELTPGLYIVSKCRLCKIFAAAAEASHSILPPPIADILALDDQVQEAHELIAPPLKIRSLDLSITDPPDLIMIRFNLELLYLKSRCVLHRRYLMSPDAASSVQFETSRKICVGSALQSLQHQATIFAACQPGGQLHDVRWYLNSLTTYDFLLASMIVCLELSRRQMQLKGIGTEIGTEISADHVPSSEELIVAMERVHDVWAKSGSRLKDAKRAARALEVMLGRIKVPSHPSSVPESSNRTMSHTLANAISRADSGTSNQNTSEYQLDLFNGNIDLDNAFDSLGDMLDMPMHFDWNTWDNHVRGENPIPDQQTGIDYDLEGFEVLDNSNSLQ